MKHPPGTVKELYRQGRIIEAARVEADAAERDGYDVTAAILRDLADLAQLRAVAALTSHNG